MLQPSGASTAAAVQGQGFLAPPSTATGRELLTQQSQLLSSQCSSLTGFSHSSTPLSTAGSSFSCPAATGPPCNKPGALHPKSSLHPTLPLAQDSHPLLHCRSLVAPRGASQAHLSPRGQSFQHPGVQQRCCFSPDGHHLQLQHQRSSSPGRPPLGPLQRPSGRARGTQPGSWQELVQVVLGAS